MGNKGNKGLTTKVTYLGLTTKVTYLGLFPRYSTN